MARTEADNKISKQRIQQFRKQLLLWYDKNRRELPWRAKPGMTPDPYHVWLSEIMLQQTTVQAVIPYFIRFLSLWPDVFALSQAPIEKVMKEWAGLGYYARARNLYACAQVIVRDFNGRFPESQNELLELPGIGDYTSAAIMAIAFNKNATVVDGNVERVMARYFAVEDPLPKSKHSLKKRASLFFDNFSERPGDLAQGLMDLGATICIPKSPRCGLCPIAKNCQGLATGQPELYPHKIRGKTKPKKSGDVYWIENAHGQVLVHRRPEKGILGGMPGFPTSEWIDHGAGKVLSFLTPKSSKDIHGKPVSIYHSFTHFDLELRLKTAKIKKSEKQLDSYFWADAKDLAELGFPSLFAKALGVFKGEKL